MLLRCRSKAGTFTINSLTPESSVSALRSEIANCTQIPTNKQIIKGGFPPQEICREEGKSLQDSGIVNGDLLTVEEGEASAIPDTVALSQAADAFAGTADADEAALLEQAIAMSMANDPTPTPPVPADRAPVPAVATATATPMAIAHEGALPVTMAVALPAGGVLVRRVVDADNSCLFNSVGYVMENKLRSDSIARKLRGVVVDAIHKAPDVYSDAVLGKSVDEYCRWIMDKDSWGGAIELSILCHYFRCQLCAVDCETGRLDCYGHEYASKAFLIYDGIHYDALAVSFAVDMDSSALLSNKDTEAFDVTVFDSDDGISTAAQQLAENNRKAKTFTNTSTFQLRCGVCGEGMKGQVEAVEHAKNTGHGNFQQC